MWNLTTESLSKEKSHSSRSKIEGNSGRRRHQDEEAKMEQVSIKMPIFIKEALDHYMRSATLSFLVWIRTVVYDGIEHVLSGLAGQNKTDNTLQNHFSNKCEVEKWQTISKPSSLTKPLL